MAETIHIEPHLLAGIRGRVAGEEIGDFFGRSIHAASVAGSLIAGPATAVYRDESDGLFDITVGFPVFAAPDPALGLETVELPGGDALLATHTGAYAALGEAYSALEAELALRGLGRTLSWERYIVGPADTQDPAYWVTEVVVPLPAAEADEPQSDLPAKMGRVAPRALAEHGITRLDQLTAYSEKEILALHGVGPKSIRILREALAERGLRFRG